MSNCSKVYSPLLLFTLLFFLSGIVNAQYVSPYKADGTKKSAADIKLEESKNKQNNSVPSTSGGSGGGGGGNNGGGTFMGGSTGGHRKNAKAYQKQIKEDNEEGLDKLSKYSYVGWPGPDKLMAVKLNGKWGYVLRDGKYVYERIPVIYDELSFAVEDRYGVKLEKKWGYVNKYGVVVIPIEYDSLVRSFGTSGSIKGTSRVVKDGKIFEINLFGKVVGRKTDILTGVMDPEVVVPVPVVSPIPQKKILVPASLTKQVWMSENLNVSHFANGDTIPEAKTNHDWEMAGIEGQPAWCYYDNDPNNAKLYGKLYNWYAVNDPRGLAPAGYHIPTATGWQAPGDGSNNKITFVSRLAGERYVKEFKALGKVGIYWTSTSVSSFTWQAIYYTSGGDDGGVDKATGLSVRCIKN
ncbi:hypothetical protein CAP36_14420 [Chitinophagaceae bacterium IBVUCB2]|nr:hypothetical protein CAP36_14420 [Chitinophagaceae bacterium IBVUCB2]